MCQYLSQFIPMQNQINSLVLNKYNMFEDGKIVFSEMIHP